MTRPQQALVFISQPYIFLAWTCRRGCNVTVRILGTPGRAVKVDFKPVGTSGATSVAKSAACDFLENTSIAVVWAGCGRA